MIEFPMKKKPENLLRLGVAEVADVAVAAVAAVAVVEIAAENNSTTLFPIPIDLIKPFTESGPPASAEAKARAMEVAAATLVEALPTSGDKAELHQAAQDLIKAHTKSEPAALPAGEDDGDE